jgi:hypothetical protein
MGEDTTDESEGGDAPDLEDIDVVLHHLDDVAREPALRRPGQITTRFTWVLVALVLAAGTFALGAKLGHDRSSSSSGSGLPTNLAAAFANRQGTGGSRAAGGSAGGAGASRSSTGGPTFGTVKLVDGGNVYVQTQSGVVKVTTAPGVQVEVSKAGTLSDLSPGETVTVEGTPDADGLTVHATSISQVTGGFGRSGGGFGSGAGGFGRAGGGQSRATGSGD